jgi:hypothetical protein
MSYAWRTAHPPLKRVALVQDQLAFQRDERHAGDVGQDLIALSPVARLEAAAHDALLHLRLTRSERAIRRLTSQLGAGARATRRAVIQLAQA